jgi:hypothetical protein
MLQNSRLANAFMTSVCCTLPLFSSCDDRSQDTPEETGLFARAIDYTISDIPFSISAGDYNGDSNPDIAILDGRGDSILTMLNDGSAHFSRKSAISVPQNVALDLASGDLNGDQFDDLVLTGEVLRAFFGKEGGTFDVTLTLSDESSLRPHIADIDGDRNNEVFVTHLEYLEFIYGNGDGTFGDAVSLEADERPSDIATADFNGDGITDIAVTNLNSENVSIVIQTESGFTRRVNYDVGSRPLCICTSDFDRDGDIDIAAGLEDFRKVAILMNNGDGTFAAPVEYVAGNQNSAIACVDFDFDDNVDIAVNNQDHGVSVLLNRGDGTFDPEIVFPTGSAVIDMVAADFDHDGDIDIVTADYIEDKLSVLLNRTR